MDTFEKDFFEQAQYPLHGVQPYKIGEPKPETDLPYTLGVSVKTVPDFQMPSSPEWEFIDQGKRYRTHFAVDKINGQWKLYVDCQGKGTFTYYDDQIHIEWVKGTSPDHYFQSLGLAIWLEMKGVICLHGNNLIKKNSGHAFIGNSGVGKSTLSLILSQHSYQIVSDDMLAVYVFDDDLYAYPSWNKIRLWSNPEISTLRAEKKVHQSFSKITYKYDKEISYGKTKLNHVTFLERNESIEFIEKDILLKDFLILILGNSILQEITRILGAEDMKLKIICTMYKKCTVKKIIYKDDIGKFKENILKRYVC